jgi:hypothetical protein
MARILNLISQLIYLSKNAKKQVEDGKYSSAKRIFKTIKSIEEQELVLIKEESDSEDFYQECLSIYEYTKKAFEVLSNFKVREAIGILDRIIALENHQLGELTNSGEGLQKEILDTIDPYIRELINEINRLSFVKQTHYSCSGHFPSRFEKGYLTIVYDWESKTKHNIQLFHNAMLKIVMEAGIIQTVLVGGKYRGKLLRFYHDLFGIRIINYYLGFSVELLTERSQESVKEEFIKQWNLILRLVKKYQDNDSLEYKKQETFIKENPDLLGEPEKLFQQGIIVRCPRCEVYMITSESKPTCNNCGYEIGNIIS